MRPRPVTLPGTGGIGGTKGPALWLSPLTADLPGVVTLGGETFTHGLGAAAAASSKGCVRRRWTTASTVVEALGGGFEIDQQVAFCDRPVGDPSARRPRRGFPRTAIGAMARFDGSIDQEETQGAVHRHQLKTGTAGLQVRQEPDPRARIPKEQEAGVRPHVGVVVLYRHRCPSAEFLDGEVYRIRVQVAQSGGPVSQIDEAGSELGRRIVTQLKKHMRTGDDERLPTRRRRFEEVERVLETGSA